MTMTVHGFRRFLAIASLIVAVSGCASGDLGSSDASEDGGGRTSPGDTGPPGHDAGGSDPSNGNTGSEDGGAGEDTSPPDASRQVPVHYGVTSGGGSASSTNYRARIRIGGSFTSGEAASGNYQIRLGAGAESP